MGTRPGLLLEFGDYLSRIGKSSRFELGEYRFAVNDDIEDAITPGDQVRLHTEGLAQFIRQTGGAWFVVSRCAILDADLHDAPPDITCRREIQLRIPMVFSRKIGRVWIALHL